MDNNSNEMPQKSGESYPDPLPMTLRLNNIVNTRTSLARVIREFSRGRVSYQAYRALIYGLSSLLAYHKAIDLDARLEALEKQLEALK